MRRKLTENIIRVQEKIIEDENYLRLLEEYRVLDKRLQGALDTMTREQRDAVMDYLGLVGEMQRKMLMTACSL